MAVFADLRGGTARLASAARDGRRRGKRRGSADDDRVQSEIVVTLDQVAVDPVAPVGVVVARISGSSAFVMELIDKLNVWQHWARRAMPPETGESNEDEIPDDPVA